MISNLFILYILMLKHEPADNAGVVHTATTCTFRSDDMMNSIPTRQLPHAHPDSIPHVVKHRWARVTRKFTQKASPEGANYYL